MKLLFDQNLAPVLVARLANLFPQSLHVREAGLERAMPLADPQSLRTIQKYLSAAAEHQPTQIERTTHLILGLLPSGRCTAEPVAR